MTTFFTVVAQTLTAAALMALAGPASAQQAYPIKPIRFIVAFPPGGSTDPIARMAAQKFAEKWGQPVIVDNRPGGNGIIGTDAVAKAPPDGYTILLVGAPHVITPSLVTTPCDAIKDFDAATTLARYRFVLVPNPSVPANTFKEFVKYARIIKAANIKLEQ